MKKYSKIKQLRNIISEIKRKLDFAGLDDDGEPIYKSRDGYPTINFKGQVKLHDTNAAVGFQGDTFWVQSRKNVISPTNDNFGFAEFAYRNIGIFRTIYESILSKETSVSVEDKVVIFGEWAGKGVQQNVAISKKGKSFYIFDIKIISGEEEYWIDGLDDYDSPMHNIYSIESFKKFQVELDINSPNKCAETIEGYVNEVEEECPVAKEFGFFGIGEGIVWKGYLDGERYTFKTKGEKHSGSSSKKKKSNLPEISPKKMADIESFIEYACNEPRLIQGIDELGMGVKPEVIGRLINWMFKDIEQEEMDVVFENDLTFDELKPFIAKATRQYVLKNS